MRDEKRDSNFFVLKKSTVQPVDFIIISWLELKNLFQTFEQQDEVEIEQEIKEIRALLDEDTTS